jgi:hypothetical protein
MSRGPAGRSGAPGGGRGWPPGWEGSREDGPGFSIGGSPSSRFRTCKSAPPLRRALERGRPGAPSKGSAEAAVASVRLSFANLRTGTPAVRFFPLCICMARARLTLRILSTKTFNSHLHCTFVASLSSVSGHCP